MNKTFDEPEGPLSSDFSIRMYFKGVVENSPATETIIVNRAALAQLLALAERPHD